MTFGQSIRTCLRKFATFSGRGSRSEFWYFTLFLWLTSSAVGLIESAIFGGQNMTSQVHQVSSDDSVSDYVIQSTAYGSGPISSLYALVTLVPSTAAAWRRMHDSGRSGWWLLAPLSIIALLMVVVFAQIFAAGLFGENRSDDAIRNLMSSARLIIPMILLGLSALAWLIVSLYWLTRPSQPGPNTYGPTPSESSQ